MKNRATALIGSFLFFCIAPAMVAGWVPWYFTGWKANAPFLGSGLGRWVGAAFALVGAAMVVESFARFALKGLGTPAPIAPTKHLVMSGLYRYVRNPMYVGVVSAIFGQALWFGSSALLAYGAAVWAAFHLFVLLYEEPTLKRQFGSEYDAFRRHVPRWLPRIKPWRGP